MKTPHTAIWFYSITEKTIRLSEDMVNMFYADDLNNQLTLDQLFEKLIPGAERKQNISDFSDFIHSPYSIWKTLNMKFRRLCHNGHFRYFEMKVFYKSETDVLVCLEDVTNEKIKENDLINSFKSLEAISNKLEGIVNNINNGVAVYRAIDEGDDFIITSFNNAASKIDKIDKEEVIGKKITDVFPLAREFGILDALKRVWETAQPEMIPIKQYKDGRISGWRENYVFKIKSGEVVAVYSDLSKFFFNKKELLKYKVAVEQSANSIVITNVEGVIEYVNKKFCSMYAYEPQEVIGENPRVLKSGNLSNDIYKDLWSSLVSGKSWNGEFENKAKDGSVVWVSASISPIFDEQKNIINFLGIQEDITEKKRAQQLLHFNESKMRVIFNTMNDLVFQVNKDGVYTYIAETNSESLAYPKVDIIGKSFFDIFPQEIADQFMSYVSEALNKQEQITKVYSLDFQQSVKWFEARLSPGSKSEVTAIIRDISQRVRAIEDLKVSESKFRDLFERSGDAILILKKGRFVECNQATLDMLGYDLKEEILFKKPTDISPIMQEDGIASLQKAAMKINLALKNGSHRFEWYHTKKNGKIFPVEVLLTKYVDIDNEIVLHTVWRDITDRKIKEREILRAKDKAEKADKFKSAFLANMSHEIRTPMNGILGFTELLSEPEITEEEKEHFVKIIRKSGMNMLNIINDILDISKVEAGEVELKLITHNVIETLNYLYDFFKPEMQSKELEWVRDFETDSNYTIEVDQFKLNELLTNLIKNALKFTHYGSISMGVESRQKDLLFHIKDTGIGIPYEKQDQIFERFIQADNDITNMVSGTGLGLAISKAYVEMHQGKIWLESIPGKGSVFYFTIPKNLQIKELTPLALNG